MENMAPLVKRLIKSPVGKYSAVNGVTKLIPFVVSVVLASLMVPSQYGTVALVVVVASVVASLTNYGFSAMVARESHLCSRQEFGELMSSSWIVSILMLTLVLAGVIFFEQLLSWTGLEYELLVCGVFLGFLLGRVDLVSKYLVAQQKIRDFSVLELCKAGATALISVVLVYVFLDNAVLARISGLLVGAVVAFFLACYIVGRRVIYLRPSKKNIDHIFAYGTNVLPQMVANWIKLGADKVVIGAAIGLDVLGAYSFMFSVCSLFMVFGAALNSAFIGPCMSMYKAGDLKGVANLRRRYMMISSVLVIICAASVALLSVVYWPDGYALSETVVALLMLSFWAQVIYLLYVKYFMYSLKMAELSYMNLLATLFYLFILIFGLSDNLTYVAFCFFIYNFLMAFYVMFRVTLLEKRLVKL